MEKAGLIMPFPSSSNPFPSPDFRAPTRTRLRHRHRRKPSLVPLKKYTSTTTRSLKSQDTAGGGQGGGWAADTFRIVNEIQHTGGIYDTIRATKIVQRAFRLKHWKTDMTSRFQELCAIRRRHEYTNAVIIQCIVRQIASIATVKHQRYTHHTTMVLKIQHLGRSFLRNQLSKTHLRIRLLNTIRSLVPSGKISNLLRNTELNIKRRTSYSHRGSITNKELQILEELASAVGLRLSVHQTLFVELLDALRWALFIQTCVLQRHAVYQHRRTVASSLSSSIVDKVMKARVFNIETVKIHCMLQDVKMQKTATRRLTREREERECMLRHDPQRQQLILQKKEDERVHLVVLEREKVQREKREELWREAVVNQKKATFGLKRMEWIESIILLDVEQSVYLCGLRLKGKRKM